MRTISLAVLLLAAGCGSGDSELPTGGSRPSVTLTLEQTTTTMSPGGTTSVMATMLGKDGHSGSLMLSVEGEPAGVVWSVRYSRTGPQSTAAVINFEASGAAVPGTYTLTVRGVAIGVDDRTAMLTLVVAGA